MSNSSDSASDSNSDATSTTPPTPIATPTPIFIDVDGVLNENWHGSDRLRRIHGPGELDDVMIAQLSSLVSQLEAKGFFPKIVISSTWRLQESMAEQLLSRFAAETVEASMTSLDSFLFRPAGDADAWKTPSFGDNASSDGRLREIRAWLAARPHSTYLVLDDLNLMFTEAGKPSGMDEIYFLHTLDEETHVAGLTAPRVQMACAKVAKQKERMKQETETGQWTADEWELLKESGLPLEVLRKHTCPFWIQDAAKQYIRNERKKHDACQTCVLC